MLNQLPERVVYWFDSEIKFSQFCSEKEQLERSTMEYIELVKSSPGATAVEQPADQSAFRDIKKIIQGVDRSLMDISVLSQVLSKGLKDYKIHLSYTQDL